MTRPSKDDPSPRQEQPRRKMLEAQTSFSRNEIFGGVLERLAQGRHEDEDLPIYLTPPYRPRRVTPLPSRQRQHGISPFHLAKLSPLGLDGRRHAVWQTKTTLPSPKHEPWWDEFIDELGIKDEAPIRRDRSPSPSPPPPPPSPTPFARPTMKRIASDQGHILRVARPQPSAVRDQAVQLYDQEESSAVYDSIADLFSPPHHETQIELPMTTSLIATHSGNTLGAEPLIRSEHGSRTTTVSALHGLDMLVLAALGDHANPGPTIPLSPQPVSRVDRTQTPSMVVSDHAQALPTSMDDEDAGEPVQHIQPALEEVLSQLQQEDSVMADGLQLEAKAVHHEPSVDQVTIDCNGNLAEPRDANNTEVAPDAMSTTQTANDLQALCGAFINNRTQVESAEVDDCFKDKPLADIELSTRCITQLDNSSAEAEHTQRRSPSLQEPAITLEVKKELADRGRTSSSPLTPTPSLELELKRRGNSELNGILTLNERQAPISSGDAGHDLVSRRSRKRVLDHAERELVKEEELRTKKQNPARAGVATSRPYRTRWTRQEESYLVYCALGYDEERCKAITRMYNQSCFPRTESAISQKLARLRSNFGSKGGEQLSLQAEGSQ